MKQYSKQMQPSIGSCTGVMESGDHFKNGASLKSLTSKKNFLFIFIMAMTVLLTCNSCSTKIFARYDTVMQAWTGQTEEHIYTVYGPPMRSQALQNNKKLVAYDYTEHIWSSATGSTSHKCEILFTIENETVTNARYRGEIKALERHIKRP
jgi:hypothetical protein